MSDKEDAFDDLVPDLSLLVGVLVGRTRVNRERDGLRVDFLRDIPEAAKGVVYRVPAPPPGPRRQLDPETLALIDRVQRARILEYFKRRRAS